MNGPTSARRTFLRRDFDGAVFAVAGTGENHFPDGRQNVLWLFQVGGISYVHCHPVDLVANFTALPFPPPPVDTVADEPGTTVERRRCPDDGRCHHLCVTGCWRVSWAGPLSGTYPDDHWPEEVRTAHAYRLGGEPLPSHHQADPDPVPVAAGAEAIDPGPAAYELDPDDEGYRKLWWHKVYPTVWRSGCGRFAIVHVRLPQFPEGPGSHVYLVRRISPHRPARGRYAPLADLGYHLDQELTLGEAMITADRWAWKDDQGSDCHVPEDYPALAMETFYWPITHTARQGTSRAALTVERDDAGCLVAKVVGMTRGPDHRYRVGIWAHMDLTDVLAGQDITLPADVQPIVVTTPGKPVRPRHPGEATRRRWWNPFTWWRS